MAEGAARRAAISWSGGKDSALALLRAREQGWQVCTFVTACHGERPQSHALPPAWFQRQVAALGGRWLPFDATAGGYEAAFTQVLAALAADGHAAMIFGDIDLAAHRDWIEPRVRKAGLAALFPLWGMPRAQLADEVLARGIQARVITVDLARLPASFCGRAYDRRFLAELPPGVCPCGEDGEFHTAVEWMPGMQESVPVAVCGVIEEPTQPPLSPGRLARVRVQEAR
ncbi:MAG: adenosine nucleotide hydrolase [Burkholderiaceae bacterium]|nr:adenosine nucleotide hydrolase [Burkholderiaceae bacterium]MCX8005779.1 adenosine nucleotide hydrolase [Burkholderiaceae bacterium]